MFQTLLIFLGAGLGGVCRYWISNATHWIFGPSFPFGTLAVNATGSFLMGFLFILILDRYNGIAPELRAFLLVGFLGGYTTFSSFSLETINLFESGAWLNAGVNIILNVTICILFALLGIMGARQL